ncbi:MAG: carbon starvation protein A [Planctomycetes bacterium]|nr:carbon starvation protein A [Planctomycetota bacterium]
MDTLILMLVCFGGYLLAYHTYGRFLARRIFRLVPHATVPSRALEDGIDYVPTKRGVIFGHHFTSIAGTGPIVGPAIGIIWGWLPAILWIFLGSIFMGAVHDFGALVVSMRNEGKSISEIAAQYINRRVRFIFFALVFLSLLIVIAIFGLVIAVVFKLFPESVLPVWLEIPIAMILGVAVYKKKVSILLATIIAVVVMYVTVGLGAYIEHAHPGRFLLPDLGVLPATGLWTIILLAYAWVASTLPVTTLLQPRDYINAWQLFVAMALLIVGVCVASFQGLLPMAAPAINTQLPADTPSLWPFMFITIACGAISGFHSLVASGTSAKQVANEEDSLIVGYGSMLTEGALAVLVIICVGAGIAMATGESGPSGSSAWHEHYASWSGVKGLESKLNAFIGGAANIIDTLGFPRFLGTAVMGVFVASFAGTTLDTSVRLQRYVVAELASDLRLPFLTNRWAATTFAVLTAAGLAFATGANGAGAMTLWPLFGAANQTLAALALLVTTLYLRKQEGLKYLVTGIPCVIMLVITNYAMVLNQIGFMRAEDPNRLLIFLGAVIFGLALWMTFEAFAVFFGSAGQMPRLARA